MSSGCIFAKTEISEVLFQLRKEYELVLGLRSVTSKKNNMLMKNYSRMSILAVSGWLEDSFDELFNISIDKLEKSEHQNEIHEITNRIHSFSYGGHVARGIMLAFGIHGLEYIEAEVGVTEMAILISGLRNFKNWRDDIAHSYRIKIPATPPLVIDQFNKIFPILKKMEKAARKYRDNHF